MRESLSWEEGSLLRLANSSDQGSSISLATNFRTWRIGQNRPGGTGPADAFFIYDETADSNRLLINTLGNVGIGTLSPVTRLAVQPTGNSSWAQGNGRGDFAVSDGTYGFSVGVSTAGGGAGRVRLWAQGGQQSITLGTPDAGNVLNVVNSGRVGINTFSTEATLHVENSDAFPSDIVRLDSTENNSQFRMTNNGNVILRGTGVPGANHSLTLGSSGFFRSGTDDLGTSATNNVCFDSALRLVTCTSSGKLKNVISAIDNALGYIRQLRPVRYRWIENDSPDIGLIAEEVAEVLPEIVSYNEHGEVSGIKPDRLASLLLAGFQQRESEVDRRMLSLSSALKSMQLENQELRAEMTVLKSRTAQMQGLVERNAQLEARLLVLESLILGETELAISRSPGK